MTPDQVFWTQTRLKALGHDPGPIDKQWGNKTWAALQAGLALPPTTPAPCPTPRNLTDADIAAAAAALNVTRAHVLAVKEVESNGGWFTDVRASILDLDGPGGFLDGPDLPKILFEAHLFSRDTGGRYDSSHPNVSSPVWNRSLYVGGQGEYARLHKAMLLNRTAALRSASWGMFQILGRNHGLAGFPTVEAFVEAMKRSEGDQLMAFVNFVKNSRLADELKLIASDGRPFARAYNGPGYATHGYHTKLVNAYRRWAA